VSVPSRLRILPVVVATAAVLGSCGGFGSTETTVSLPCHLTYSGAFNGEAACGFASAIRNQTSDSVTIQLLFTCVCATPTMTARFHFKGLPAPGTYSSANTDAAHGDVTSVLNGSQWRAMAPAMHGQTATGSWSLTLTSVRSIAASSQAELLAVEGHFSLTLTPSTAGASPLTIEGVFPHTVKI
jgi:hypothetical protein